MVAKTKNLNNSLMSLFIIFWVSLDFLMKQNMISSKKKIVNNKNIKSNLTSLTWLTRGSIFWYYPCGTSSSSPSSVLFSDFSIPYYWSCYTHLIIYCKNSYSSCSDNSSSSSPSSSSKSFTSCTCKFPHKNKNCTFVMFSFFSISCHIFFTTRILFLWR